MHTHLKMNTISKIKKNDPKGGVKEGPKTRISSVLVFKIDPPVMRKKPKKLLKLKLYSLLVDLHGRGIRLLVVLEGKGTGLLVVKDRKGMGLIVDIRGREWIPPVREEMSSKNLQVRGNESMKNILN